MVSQSCCLTKWMSMTGTTRNVLLCGYWIKGLIRFPDMCTSRRCFTHAVKFSLKLENQQVSANMSHTLCVYMNVSFQYKVKTCFSVQYKCALITLFLILLLHSNENLIFQVEKKTFWSQHRETIKTQLGRMVMGYTYTFTMLSSLYFSFYDVHCFARLKYYKLGFIVLPNGYWKNYILVQEGVREQRDIKHFLLLLPQPLTK